VLIQFQFRYQTPDAALELAVLGSVDERIDAAVGVHQYHAEVVNKTLKVDTDVN